MRLTVLTHVKDEEELLPHWLRHHLPLFDHGVVVDRGSTDRSREIVRELAPHWDLVASRSPDFEPYETDAEMMALERRHEGWKLTLTVTELLFCADLRAHLREVEARDPGIAAIEMRVATMVDPWDAREAALDPGVPLAVQRFHGHLPVGFGNVLGGRVLHRHADGDYNVGRHFSGHATVPDPELIVQHLAWAPYSLVRARKLRVQAGIPAASLAQGFGSHHAVEPGELDAQYAVQAAHARDLREDPAYRAALERLCAREGLPVPPPGPAPAPPPPAAPGTLVVSEVGYRFHYGHMLHGHRGLEDLSNWFRILDAEHRSLQAEHAKLMGLHAELWAAHGELQGRLALEEAARAGLHAEHAKLMGLHAELSAAHGELRRRSAPAPVAGERSA